MNLLEEQVRASLEVYYKRGQKVIELLGKGELDRALQLLRLRKAAFHNFRVAENRLYAEKDWILEKSGWSELFEKIDRQDSWLIEAFQTEAERSGRDLRSLSKEREKIRNFKAVKRRSGSFQRSV